MYNRTRRGSSMALNRLHEPRRRMYASFSTRVSSTVLSLLFFGMVCEPASAWPGFQWEQWKEVSTWQRPAIENKQVGKKTLVPLLAAPDGSGRGINEIRQWENKRAVLGATIERILGRPAEAPASAPATSPRKASEVVVLDETRFPDPGIFAFEAQRVIGYRPTCWCRCPSPRCPFRR